MFAGHVGAALLIGRAERGVNLGVFVAAALLLDVLLWVFVLLDWESVVIPADFANTHQPHFVFPFSHSLVAGLAWSVVAALVALGSRIGGAALGTVRAAWLVAAAVFSHWLLDGLVHQPELTLAGAGSATVGLGLWGNMPSALVVEAAVVVAGLAWFMPGSGLSRGRSIGLVALALVVLAFTVAGMTVAPAPPSVRAMAASSLGAIAAVCAAACWLGRRSPGGHHPDGPSTGP